MLAESFHDGDGARVPVHPGAEARWRDTLQDMREIHGLGRYDPKAHALAWDAFENGWQPVASQARAAWCRTNLAVNGPSMPLPRMACGCVAHAPGWHYAACATAAQGVRA